MSTDVLTRQSLRERDGGVWAYVSASRLALWLKCPLAFRLKYIDGVPTPTSPSLFLGKVVHSGLEHWYRHRQLGIALDTDEVTRRVAAEWDQSVAEANVPFGSTEEEQSLRRQAADLVSAYVRQVPPDEGHPLAVEAAMEWPLVDPRTRKDLGVPLVGIVDLIVDDKDGPVIADFKSSSRSSSPMEISHEIQLGAYSYLFRQTTGQEEAGLEIRSLVKTKTPKIEFHRFAARSEAHFGRLFAVVREYLDALDAGRFNYRPNWGCSMCDYCDSHCRQWSG